MNYLPNKVKRLNNYTILPGNTKKKRYEGPVFVQNSRICSYHTFFSFDIPFLVLS